MEALAGQLIGSAVAGALSDNSSSDRAYDAAANASGVAAQATQQQAALSKEMWDYYKTNFQPLEKNLTADAQSWLDKAKTYGSPEEQEKAAGVAHADNTQAFANARNANTRTMASYGINPASGKFGDTNLKSNLAEAKSDVLAQNTARQVVKDTGFSKSVAATGVAQNVDALGRGLPAAAQTGLASAAAGSTAAANSNFLQGNVLQQQQVAGLSPIVAAAKAGVSKWFQTPMDEQPVQLSGPVG